MGQKRKFRSEGPQKGKPPALGGPLDDLKAADELAARLRIPLGEVTRDMLERFKRERMSSPTGPIRTPLEFGVVSSVKKPAFSAGGMKVSEPAEKPVVSLEIQPASIFAHLKLEELPDAISSFALAGVKPFENLPKHPAKRERPEIMVDFPDSDLAEIKRIIDSPTPVNSLGWGITKGGETRFFVPQMTDVHIGHSHFDETKVIEEIKQGGVDSVFMLVSGIPGIADAGEFFKSRNTIRKETGVDVPMYLLSIGEPFESVAKVWAFRLNPSVDDGEIQRMVDMRDEFFREFIHGQNSITEVGVESYDQKAIETMVKTRTKYTAEYVRRKTGRDDFAEYVKGLLGGLEETMVEQTLSEKDDAGPQKFSAVYQLSYNFNAAEQMFFWALFQHTGVMEQASIVKPIRGIMPFEGAGRLYRAIVDITSGLKIDDDKKFEHIWELAREGAKLGPHIQVLKPIAKAIDEGGYLDGATLGAIDKHLDAMGKCSRYRLIDDDLFDNEVAMTVARGSIREKLWEKTPIEGMNTPAEINDTINTLIELSKDTNPKLRSHLSDTLKTITGHTLDELQKDEELMEVHASPVAEIIHYSIGDGINQLREQRKEAEESLEEARQTTEEQAKRSLEQQNQRCKERNIIPLTTENVRRHREGIIRKAEARSQKEFLEIDGYIKKLSDAMKVTSGDYTSEMLGELANSSKRVLQEEETPWVDKRRRFDEPVTYELFPGQSRHDKQTAFGRCISPAYPLNIQPAVEEASVLIRDLSCFAQTIPKAGAAGTIGGVLAEAGVKIGDEDRRALQAHLRLKSAEWGDTSDFSDRSLAKLAREKLFASHAFGSDSMESRSYESIVEDRIPEDRKETYRKIEEAYRIIIKALPPNMK